MGKAKDLTPGQRESIARELFEVRDSSGDELHGLCPFHGDTNPSFSYNIDKDVYNCFSCSRHGDLIRMWSKIKGTGDEKEDFKAFCERYGIRTGGGGRQEKPQPNGDSIPDQHTKKSVKTKKGSDNKKVTQAIMDQAWAKMTPLPEAWQKRLQETRGWSPAAIAQLDLRAMTVRWDKRRGELVPVASPDRIAIPVRDIEGKLRNIRCYKPGAKEMKIFSFAPGTGDARLFPAKPEDGDGVVMVVEGEPDCICAISKGFDAITQTSKTKYWPKEQSQLFLGRDVVIAYDADQPGQRYAVHAAESLLRNAKRVRLLIWPDYMGRQSDGNWPEDHGQDLTDFFIKHGRTAADLQALIETSVPFGVDQAKNSCALDFFDPGVNGRLSFKPRLLADRLMSDMEIVSDPETSLLYRWNGAYYERYAEDHIEAAGIALLGDEAQQSRVRDAVYQARKMATLPYGRAMDDRDPWVCVSNGMLNLSTVELAPHGKDFYSSYQLPVNFDADRSTRCERFLQFLDETIQTPGPIAQVQEFAGYCLTRDVRFEKALLLLGPGADGKSKLMSVLEALAGRENCSAVSFPDLEDQFHRSSLYGKLINISTEVGNKAMESAYFKAIVSGDPISAAFKHQNAFQFRPYCKLIFAGNRLPRILDNSDGTFRRLLPIQFKRQFLDGGDKYLLDKLLDELSDIFQWALVGLHRLWEQGDFTDCDETRQIMMDHRRANNPVQCFVEDLCVIGEREIIQKKELYKEYKRYAESNGYSIMGRENFFRELYAAVNTIRQCRPRVNEGGREYYINGISVDLHAKDVA